MTSGAMARVWSVSMKGAGFPLGRAGMTSKGGAATLVCVNERRWIPARSVRE